MHKAWKDLIGRLAVAAITIAGAGAVAAQDYPARPVRLIVPSPPGGGTDAMARLLSNRLGETVQWQFVVDNRAGAGGNIGMDAAAKSAPDGYTLVMGESANLTINQFLYASMPFDPARDLAPVTLVATVPLVLVVPPSRPYGSVAELVAQARRAGPQAPLTFASGGNGTVGHLMGEVFMRRVGITLQHVPYRGGAAAVTDVMAGHVDLHFASLPAATAQIEGGQLRALAVTAPERVPQLPNVPTLTELGYQGLEAAVVYGLLAPAGTPAPILSRLNAEVNRALQSSELRTGLTRIGAVPRGGTGEAFATFLDAERARWGEAVRASGARVD